MASKEKMILEIYEVFNTFKHLLDWATLDEEKLYTYAGKFETYKQIKLVYNFMFKGPTSFYAILTTAQTIWKRLEPEVWPRLKINCQNHQQILDLNAKVKLVKQSWVKRPRPPKKSELPSSKKKIRSRRS